MGKRFKYDIFIDIILLFLSQSRGIRVLYLGSCRGRSRLLQRAGGANTHEIKRSP